MRHNSTRSFLKQPKHVSSLKFHSILPRTYLRRQSHRAMVPISPIDFLPLDKGRFFWFSFIFKLRLPDKFKFLHKKEFNSVKSSGFRSRRYFLLKSLHFRCFISSWIIIHDSWIQLMTQHSLNAPARNQPSCFGRHVLIFHGKCILSKSCKVIFIECFLKSPRNHSSFIRPVLMRNQKSKAFVLLTLFVLFFLAQVSFSSHQHSFFLLPVFSSLPPFWLGTSWVLVIVFHNYLWVLN